MSQLVPDCGGASLLHRALRGQPLPGLDRVRLPANQILQTDGNDTVCQEAGKKEIHQNCAKILY
jgi:hypothetical protein